MNHVGFALLIGLLSAALSPAYALKFTPIEDDGYGHRVLLIHDCHLVRENKNCTGALNSFDADDLQRMRAAWKGNFDEVWLLSGGGNLNAGIQIANELRSQKATVRVPSFTRLARAGIHVIDLVNPFNCVSACTVAFMGGQFRLIDPEATYEVHASSSVSWNWNTQAEFEDIRKIVNAYNDLITKEGGLRAASEVLTMKHRELARSMFLVFQETLWLTIQDESTPAGRQRRLNEQRQRDQALTDFLREGLNRPYAYDPSQLARDEAILALEGPAALQDILMRIERSSMDQSIAGIRRFAPRLGRRADAALAMLAAMYDTSSIKETNKVPRETLLKMGYITEFTQ
jgi:hypothetical protein